MPLVTPEGIGTTRRSCLSPRRRLQAWERTNGKCVVCGSRIDGARERWIVEHIRALELGGADDLTNMGPAHETCGREKTRDDHARTARAKRQKLRHIGAAIPERPLPGSRTSPFKRKLNGAVVLRGRRTPQPAQTAQMSPPGEAAQPILSKLMAELLSQDCTDVPLSPKENRAGTAEQMAKQTKTANAAADAAELAPSGAAASGDIFPAIPSHLHFLFAQRPILPGEDPDEYDAVLRAVVQKVRPTNFSDTIRVRDIVRMIWQSQRMQRWQDHIHVEGKRRAAEAMLTAALHKGDDYILEMSQQEARKYADTWVRKAENWHLVDRVLAQGGLTHENASAHGFLLSLADIERIDRLIASADQRREGLLRDIERARANSPQQPHVITTDIVEAGPSRKV